MVKIPVLNIVFSDFFFCAVIHANANNNSINKFRYTVFYANISGGVVDSSGNPLSGASVTEKGRGNAVVTNGNGE